jgi:hypothetical protein
MGLKGLKGGLHAFLCLRGGMLLLLLLLLLMMMMMIPPSVCGQGPLGGASGAAGEQQGHHPAPGGALPAGHRAPGPPGRRPHPHELPGGGGLGEKSGRIRSLYQR